jgi:hypothetical protein
MDYSKSKHILSFKGTVVGNAIMKNNQKDKTLP